jgi:hypothetical protein
MNTMPCATRYSGSGSVRIHGRRKKLGAKPMRFSRRRMPANVG